jgi:hypothetical protein
MGVVMLVRWMVVLMLMVISVIIVVVMVCIGVVMLGVVLMGVDDVARLVDMRLLGLRRIERRTFNDLAADALAVSSTARIAVARSAAVGAILRFFLSLAVSALVGLDQRLTVGDGNLIIIGMDFAEGQKTVAVATVFDEGRLQGGFYPRNLGEVDVAAELFALGSLEIKFFDAIAAHHNDPGLFRVGGVD